MRLLGVASVGVRGNWWSSFHDYEWEASRSAGSLQDLDVNVWQMLRALTA